MFAYNSSHVFHRKAGIIYSITKVFSLLNVCQLRHAARKRRSICEKHITDVCDRFYGLLVIPHAKSLDDKFPYKGHRWVYVWT